MNENGRRSFRRPFYAMDAYATGIREARMRLVAS